MYEFKYNDGSAYIRQKNLATAEDYEAAWELTETVDATCTKAGKTVYTCTACGDSYEEEIKASGHEAGKWEVTKKAEAFRQGERVKKCTVCGEVLETESIAQTFPLPLWSVIAVGAVAAALIAVVVVLVIRKKKHENITENEKEL